VRGSFVGFFGARLGFRKHPATTAAKHCRRRLSGVPRRQQSMSLPARRSGPGIRARTEPGTECSVRCEGERLLSAPSESLMRRPRVVGRQGRGRLGGDRARWLSRLRGPTLCCSLGRGADGRSDEVGDGHRDGAPSGDAHRRAGLVGATQACAGQSERGQCNQRDDRRRAAERSGMSPEKERQSSGLAPYAR
jgi:hypothetical protein